MTELDPAILDGLLEYDTPTICNAIEEMEVRDPVDGYMGWDVRCMYPDLGRMVGYAVTATGRSTVPGSPQRGDGFAQWFELVEQSPKPAVLVLKDVGPDRYRSAHCGDVMVTISLALGAIGLVTDGGVRDFETVHELGFRYFASGLVAAHGTPEIVQAGLDVTISGTLVRTGDIIHADVNGVAVLPPEHCAEILERCPGVLEIEERRRALANSPGFKAADVRNMP